VLPDPLTRSPHCIVGKTREGARVLNGESLQSVIQEEVPLCRSAARGVGQPIPRSASPASSRRQRIPGAGLDAAGAPELPAGVRAATTVETIGPDHPALSHGWMSVDCHRVGGTSQLNGTRWSGLITPRFDVPLCSSRGGSPLLIELRHAHRRFVSSIGARRRHK
jgi:hypothetical protein